MLYTPTAVLLHYENEMYFNEHYFYNYSNCAYPVLLVVGFSRQNKCINTGSI